MDIVGEVEKNLGEVHQSTGCDHSKFLVVPDWYANGCCRVLALEQTQYSMYLVFKIRFISTGF